MKSIPPSFRRLAHWAALALAAGSAAAALAGQAGRWSLWLDILNHLAPFWLAGAALALTIWLALGRSGRVIPAAAMLALAISTLQIAPEFLAHADRGAPVAGAETLKIVQFNTWKNNQDQAATLRWIKAENADVVLVEEGCGAPKVKDGLRPQYRFRRTTGGRGFCEAMIFSKQEPVASEGFMERLGFPLVWAAFQGPGGPYVIAAVHTTWPMPAGPQEWQSRMMARALAGLPKQRMIIGGDFNSTPWSFALARQDKRLGLERRSRGLTSWPTPLPVLPIDHLYAGPGWRTLTVRRGPALGSDHYPLIVTLQASPAARIP
jgi:endonuclease/exonuclease/phosphatase (EEP) superfamily protein YafD